MPEKNIAIVFDCGATNVRVVAMDTYGQIIASHSLPNETDEDPHYPDGRIWDIEKLWNKLCNASKIVTQRIDTKRIAGVTVTTFGVDGTFVNQDGELLYPVISWQCKRTNPIMKEIGKYIPLEELYATSGVFPYAFNTINKMIWFRENIPEIPESAHRFLFIPSLFIHKLTGVMQNDATMMGTSMMADLKKRDFSDSILQKIGISRDLFGEMAEPGTNAGLIHQKAAAQTGIPKGTPVFIAGHDTQFAIIGSGAKINQPVLSSGTWEILMTRSDSFRSTEPELKGNITTEADAEKGIFNIGQNWLGSGVLEWFSGNFYPNLKGDDLYETMIAEAEKIEPGSHNLTINPDFYGDGNLNKGGAIYGLTIHTQRSMIYRALLESMACRLRAALEALQKAGSFKAEKIICVGGGSKNNLWNQIRADICNLQIEIIDQKETTVLGAACFVFAGCGKFCSVKDARLSINSKPTVFNPGRERDEYEKIYKQYCEFKKLT